jgi:hypothetical protein
LLRTKQMVILSSINNPISECRDKSELMKWAEMSDDQEDVDLI